MTQAGPTSHGHMPRRRAGATTAVTIDGEDFYLTANARDDGSLGAVFLSWGKHGQTPAGLMDSYAIALSLGLRQGAPLLDLVDESRDLYFVPLGGTDDPDIPRVRSIVDWVARRLALDWLPHDVCVAAGIVAAGCDGSEGAATTGSRPTRVSARPQRRLSPLAADDGNVDPVAGVDQAIMEAFRVELANGIGSFASLV
jgi:hypothetical protein